MAKQKLSNTAIKILSDGILVLLNQAVKKDGGLSVYEDRPTAKSLSKLRAELQGWGL